MTANPIIHDDLDDCELAYLCSWSRFERQTGHLMPFDDAIERWRNAFDTIIGSAPPHTVDADAWHRVRQLAAY